MTERAAPPATPDGGPGTPGVGRGWRTSTSSGGLALVGAGAVLGALSFTVLPWFFGSVGVLRGSRSSVGDIGDLLDNLVARRHALGDRRAIRLGLSEYYYSWLAWLLLAAAVVVAVVACLPTSERRQVRALGAGLAALGIVATLWAVDVYRADVDVRPGRPVDSAARVPDGPGFSAFVQHLSAGGWCALVAFVLIGAGALIGPRRAAATD